MSHKLIALTGLLGSVFAFIALWCYVLDTSTHRSIVASDIQDLVSTAKENPNQTVSVDELLRLANSEYNFEATYATSAIGDLGDAATSRIEEIALLLDSPSPFVRREAALTLAKLGPRSAPALDRLQHKVATDSPSDDETWFAAMAIGEIGSPAIECLPLLKSMIGTGAPQFDDCLEQAIEKLERIKTDN